MKIKKTVKAVSFYKDGQDGGGHTTIYPNMDLLVKDLDIDEEHLQEILDEDDPYENGEIDQDVSIEVEVDTETLEVTLVGEINVHWGQ